jgi:serine/threonine protein kinase
VDAGMIKSGDMFGEYRVVKSLGKGGMGEVWLLQIEERREFYAVKVLDPELAAKDREFRKRFLREAELAMSIKHPNLIEVFDVGQDPETGLCYLLMEYVPGGSLYDLLKDTGAIKIRDALKTAYQIADALDCISIHGVVHRDIKPDNILFSADGKVKIADLGIARQSLDSRTMTMTQTGVVIGTPAYMAPEQMIDAHNVDIRADIYSLGIVLYEMLAGKRPNDGDTVVQLLAKAMRGEPIPDVRTIRPEVPVAVAELVNMMCAMEVESRTSSPREVMVAISEIFRGRSAPAVRRSLTRGLRCPPKKVLKYSFASFASTMVIAGLVVLGVYGVRNYGWDKNDVAGAQRDENFSVSSNITHEKYDQTNILDAAIKIAAARQNIVKTISVGTNTISEIMTKRETNAIMAVVEKNTQSIEVVERPVKSGGLPDVVKEHTVLNAKHQDIETLSRKNSDSRRKNGNSGTFRNLTREVKMSHLPEVYKYRFEKLRSYAGKKWERGRYVFGRLKLEGSETLSNVATDVWLEQDGIFVGIMPGMWSQLEPKETNALKVVFLKHGYARLGVDVPEAASEWNDSVAVDLGEVTLRRLHKDNSANLSFTLRLPDELKDAEVKLDIINPYVMSTDPPNYAKRQVAGFRWNVFNGSEFEWDGFTPSWYKMTISAKGCPVYEQDVDFLRSRHCDLGVVNIPLAKTAEFYVRQSNNIGANWVRYRKPVDGRTTLPIWHQNAEKRILELHPYFDGSDKVGILSDGLMDGFGDGRIECLSYGKISVGEFEARENKNSLHKPVKMREPFFELGNVYRIKTQKMDVLVAFSSYRVQKDEQDNDRNDNRVFSPKEIRAMKDSNPFRAISKTLRVLFAGWKISSMYENNYSRSRLDMQGVGFRSSYNNKDNVLITKGTGVLFERYITVPKDTAEFSLSVCASEKCFVEVVVSGIGRFSRELSGDNQWDDIKFHIGKKLRAKRAKISIGIKSRHKDENRSLDIVVGWKMMDWKETNSR